MENDSLQWLQSIQQDLREKTAILQEYNDMVIMLPIISGDRDFKVANQILRKYREIFRDSDEDTDDIEAYFVKRAIKNGHALWIIKDCGVDCSEHRCSLRIPLLGEEDVTILSNAFKDHLTEQGYKITKVVRKRYQWSHNHMYLDAEIETNQ